MWLRSPDSDFLTLFELIFPFHGVYHVWYFVTFSLSACTKTLNCWWRFILFEKVLLYIAEVFKQGMMTDAQHQFFDHGWGAWPGHGRAWWDTAGADWPRATLVAVRRMATASTSARLSRDVMRHQRWEVPWAVGHFASKRSEYPAHPKKMLKWAPKIPWCGWGPSINLLYLQVIGCFFHGFRWLPMVSHGFSASLADVFHDWVPPQQQGYDSCYHRIDRIGGPGPPQR